MVAQALDPRRMTLAKKDVAKYAGVAVPFYERWAHRHEFLLRCQQRGETVEEYFWAKRGLLVEGDTYGDMMAAYPAYWSGLWSRELVVLMDARVLGRVWPGQIMGRDPQIEEWAADTAPDVGALQQLLSTLDNRRAVWVQIRAFRWDGSRGQREEGNASQNPPGVTKGEGHLEPATGPDQKPGAGGVAGVSHLSMAPLRRRAAE